MPELVASIAVDAGRIGVDAGSTIGAVAIYERVGLHAVRRSDTWERTA